MARQANTGSTEPTLVEEPSIDSIIDGIEGTDNLSGTSKSDVSSDERVFLETDGKIEVVFLKDIDVLKTDPVGFAGEIKMYRTKKL
jgi:hypothetical protein